MIAIDTIRLTAATIAARLTATWPGAPRSCASASAGANCDGIGTRASTLAASQGISSSAPTSRHAIAP